MSNSNGKYIQLSVLIYKDKKYILHLIPETGAILLIDSSNNEIQGHITITGHIYYKNIDIEEKMGEIMPNLDFNDKHLGWSIFYVDKNFKNHFLRKNNRTVLFRSIYDTVHYVFELLIKGEFPSQLVKKENGNEFL